MLDKFDPALIARPWRSKRQAWRIKHYSKEGTKIRITFSKKRKFPTRCITFDLLLFRHLFSKHHLVVPIKQNYLVFYTVIKFAAKYKCTLRCFFFVIFLVRILLPVKINASLIANFDYLVVLYYKNLNFDVTLKIFQCPMISTFKMNYY